MQSKRKFSARKHTFSRSMKTCQRELESNLESIKYQVLTPPTELTSKIFTKCLPDHGRVRPSPQTAPLAVTQICRQWRESHFAPTSSGTVLISDSSLTVGHISVAPPYFTPQGVSRMTLFPGVPYSTPNYTWISEACLTLDVFTPASNRGAKLPVLVLSPIISWYPHVLSADKVAFWWWFQRGIFLCHRHAAHSRALHCREPVVIVAAKYRLSVFGFLSGKEAKIFALEEVQLHISAFGDDPERVVLGGGKCRTDVHGALTPIQQTRLAGIVPRRVHVNETSNMYSYNGLSLTWAPHVEGDVVQNRAFQYRKEDLRRWGATVLFHL
ncbi:Alpha/Beta hydrolase protein [Mycena galericulata]|nr:Alpha/Beta hydrolase protein [Mycena galericulata]